MHAYSCNKDSFLILEFNRTKKRLNKLNLRFRKRVSSRSLDDLSKKRRYYLIRKIRKLKARLEHLKARLRLGIAGGTIAASVLLSADLQAQSLSEGDAIKVHEDSDLIQNQTVLDTDGEGNLLVVWRDNDSDKVLGQWFDEGRNPEGDVLELAADMPSVQYRSPQISMDNDGDFVLVLDVYDQNASVYKNSILVRPFSAEGIADSENEKTIQTAYDGNGDASNESLYPRVDLNNDGDMVVAWQTYSGDSYDYTVYGQSYVNGVWTDHGMLNADLNYEALSPSVAINRDGDFLVAWSEYSENYAGDDYFSVKYRRYENGSLGTEMVAQASSAPIVNAVLPNVHLADNDEYVVAFHNSGSSGTINSRRYDAENSLQGTIELGSSLSLFDLEMQVDKSGNQNFVGTNGTNTYYYRYDKFGSEKFSDSNTSLLNITSVHIALNDNDAIIGWNNSSGDDLSSAYIKEYMGGDGLTFSSNDLPIINELNSSEETFGDPSGFNISDPSYDGNFVVAWAQTIASETQIFAQRYNSEGDKQGDNILISKNNGTINDFDPKVSVDNDGNFVVAWIQDGATDDHLMLRLFDSEGVASGSEFQAATMGSEPTSEDFDLAYENGIGGLIFDNGTVQVRKFLSTGSFFSSATEIVNTNTNLPPQITMDQDGDAFVVWEDGLFLKGAGLSASATVINSPLTISEESISTDKPAIASYDDDAFIAAWRANGQIRHRMIEDWELKEVSGFDFSHSFYDIKSVSYNDSRIQMALADQIVILNEHGTVLEQYDDHTYYFDLQSVRTENGLFFGGTTFSNLQLSELDFGPSFGGDTWIVNAQSTNEQINPQIARASDGSYIIVWEEQEYSDSELIGSSIHAQRYDDANCKVGGEMIIAEPGEVDGDWNIELFQKPDVALNNNGNFSIVYEIFTVPEIESGTFPYQGLGVELYDANGNEIGTEFFGSVDSEDVSTRNSFYPEIGMNDNGAFMVAWTQIISEIESSTITLKSQNFNSDGSISGAVVDLEDPFTTFLPVSSKLISLDMMPSGEYALAWSNIVTDEVSQGFLNVMKYNADGSNAWENTWSQSIDLNLLENDITLSPDGLVTAVHITSSTENTDVQGHRFDENGNEQLLGFGQLGETNARGASVESDGDGIIIAVKKTSDPYLIELHRLDNNGNKVTNAVSMTHDDVSLVGLPALAVDGGGDVIVTWAHSDESDPDIYAREQLSPFPEVNFDALTVEEDRTLELTDKLEVNDNFGSQDWDLQITKAGSNGDLSLGQETTLTEGSNFTEDNIQQLGLYYEHDGSETGEDDFSLTVESFYGYHKSFTIPIDITNVNDNPVLNSQVENISTNEDEALSFAIPENQFSDEETTDLTYSASLEDGSELPAWLTFSESGITFSGTPSNEDVAQLSIQLTATDNGGLTVSDIFGLTVENTNDAPTVLTAIEDKQVNEDALISFIADDIFEDVDEGDVVTTSVSLEDGSDLPAWLSYDQTSGQFSGTPLNENVGSISIKLTGTDAAGESAEEIFSILVINTNDAPTLTGSVPDQTITVGDAFDLTIDKSAVFSDVDGDVLSLSLQTSEEGPIPEWLDFDSETNNLSGVPLEGDEGNTILRVTASDPAGESVNTVFIIQVEPTEPEEEPLGLTKNEIQIYPNPVINELNLNWNSSSTFKAQVIDYSGQVMIDNSVDPGENLDVSGLPEGNYILKIGNASTIVTFKFVKQYTTTK